MNDLPIAVRVYPDLTGTEYGRTTREKLTLPEAILIFDCESRIDETQALTFGGYRFVVRGECLEEGLFYADDVSKGERLVLERYARMHRAETGGEGSVADLKLLSLEQFLEKLYRAAYKGRCLLVNFNCNFDISRCAYDFSGAHKRFLGGFSFKLWHYRDNRGRKHINPYRIRIAIKHIDSKRALKGFTGGREPDDVDQIPEGSTTGAKEADYVFRGHILDLRTLAFALTDRGYSLESACEAFGVEHGKIKVQEHGIVTEAYIDYNRRDVLATAELAEKLLAEYGRHPITLQATKAYSPASIGKGCLRAMGVAPILQRQPGFPKRYLGAAQSAFYGGRASTHIRKIPAPVVYTDFLSEYSTVNVLLGLWRFVTAKKIRVVESPVGQVQDLLREVSPAWVLDPTNWKHLAGFARVIPDGDVLPLRAQYGGNDWQIGINHAHAASDDPRGGLWYGLPDLVASVLLTGKQPRIVEAFRIVPEGTLDGLTPISFRGQVSIDPRKDDFFKIVIEERQRLAQRSDLDDVERGRLNKSLKTFGSATSYGIFAQMDRRESDQAVRLTCYGIDAQPYECRAAHPEAPGDFCFPPIASLVTSGGRLMLALLERLVTDRGGTYAMEDTDSMAIVATRRGGLIPCPGGPRRTKDGQEAIRALSWAEVRDIAQEFEKLNPYGRGAVPGSILKIEADNFDPTTQKQRQLWCYAISAKRYALFLRNENGAPELLRHEKNNADDRWSEHGLGHLLNPTDPDADDREWIAQAWLRIIRKALGFRTVAPRFARVPAVGRTTVSSPWLMRSLRSFNAGKSYAQQIKPFNFLLSAQVRELGHPVGVDPQRFHLIAPYESNPKKWLTLPWIDAHTGQRHRVSTAQTRSPKTAGLKTYGDVLRSYEFHPEVKCAGPDGKPCSKQTIGLLSRRHIRIGQVRFIGKESNRLEEAEAGSIHSRGDVYTEYPDERRDEWATTILPIIKTMPMQKLMKLSGLSRSTLQAIRAGRRPHAKNQAILAGIARQFEND